MNSCNNDGGLIGWIAIGLLAVGIAMTSVYDSQRAVFLNTLYFGLFTSGIVIPVSLVAAWAAAGRNLTSRILVFTCVGLVFVPLIMQVSAWDAAFGRLGWLTSTRGEVLKPILSGWYAAVWVASMALIPQITLLFLIGWFNSHRAFEEQARLDATPAGVFWHVSLPRLVPIAMIGIIWVFVSCLREIAITDIYRIGTLAEQIYLGYSLNTVNGMNGTWSEAQIADARSLGTSISILIVAWISVSAIWMITRITSIDWFSRDQISHQPISRFNTAKTATVIGLLVLLLLVPFANLFYRAGLFVQPVDGVPTMAWSAEVLGSSLRRAVVEHRSEFSSSIAIAFYSTIGIMLMACWLAWRAQKSGLWKFVFVLLLALSLSIPGPMVGSGLVRLFTSVNVGLVNWFYDYTLGPPVMANIFFCWPFAGMLMWALFRRVAVDARDSATLDGVSDFHQWISLGLGGNKPGILGCALLTFMWCFGELSASQMVLPPGVDTIPRLTLGFLHAGVDEMTAALTIVMTAAIILVSLAGWAFVRLNYSASRRQ